MTKPANAQTYRRRGRNCLQGRLCSQSSRPAPPLRNMWEEQRSQAGQAGGQVLVSIPSYLCHVNRAGRRHQRDSVNLLDMPPRYWQAASYPTALWLGFFRSASAKKKLSEHVQPFVTAKARGNELPVDCTTEVWPQHCPRDLAAVLDTKATSWKTHTVQHNLDASAWNFFSLSLVSGHPLIDR